MYWSFTILVYANTGSLKKKITCALVVSLTVVRLSIVFSSLRSCLGIFVDLKKPKKTTFSSFLATLEETYSWKKVK